MAAHPEAGDYDRQLIFSIFRSTGVKMFLILTLALLPLGLVALFASLQAIRTADVERKALLRVAATQSARKLAAELMSDQAALRLAVNTLSRGTGDAGLCGRAEAFLRSRASTDVRLVIYARDGRRVCGSAEQGTARPAGERFATRTAELLPAEKRLLVRTRSADGRLVALAFYGRDYLDRATDPATALMSRQVILSQGSRQLEISDGSVQNGGRVDSVVTRVHPTDIVLTLVVRDPPRTLARMLSLFLPMLMWFAAAAIGWFVVHRLLIQPLVDLRRTVADYEPGQVIEPRRRLRTPAREIMDLGDTFREISEDVATHEAEMAEGLERQRRLTREVHHRVKNNLQIIASLINLHSRSVTTPEATEAYGSIQRRVDALSVVHRNHYYAELEENRGVGIRALVSELSASLRASSTDPARGLMIQVDSDHLHVTQDVAVSVAFLVTELVELAMMSAPRPVIRITVRTLPEPGRAVLRIESPALCPSDIMQAHLDGRFQRVLTGLSRQLRSPLDHDQQDGAFSIGIGILDAGPGLPEPTT